ncbi:CRAL-TRIO domain-containing protein [Schizophyllum commune]
MAAPASPQKTHKVLTTLPPGTVIAPIHEYDEDQRKMMKDLREYAETLRMPDTDSYAPWELRWLNKPDTIPRYCRAAKWNYQDAQKRLRSTLEWRRDFKPDLIPPDEVKVENETGKITINGFDRDGRPIIYMRPGYENTERSNRQLRNLVWWLERGKDLMPPGQESLVIIVDYKSTTIRNNPSVSIAIKVLHILQQHYVETLGRAMVVNLPMLLNFFYKGISPFLDPVTRDKMRFNPNLLDFIAPDQLDAQFGGEHYYEFEFESFWAQIVEACRIAPDGSRLPDDSQPSTLPSELVKDAQVETAAVPASSEAASTADLVEDATIAQPAQVAVSA